MEQNVKKKNQEKEKGYVTTLPEKFEIYTKINVKTRAPLLLAPNARPLPAPTSTNILPLSGDGSNVSPLVHPNAVNFNCTNNLMSTSVIIQSQKSISFCKGECCLIRPLFFTFLRFHIIILAGCVEQCHCRD